MGGLVLAAGLSPVLPWSRDMLVPARPQGLLPGGSHHVGGGAPALGNSSCQGSRSLHGAMEEVWASCTAVHLRWEDSALQGRP